jgi:uncharacterized protein (DUF433 family)
VAAAFAAALGTRARGAACGGCVPGCAACRSVETRARCAACGGCVPGCRKRKRKGKRTGIIRRSPRKNGANNCETAADRAILEAMQGFDRITIDPAVCTGKPCIRGLRFPVSRVLGLLAAGQNAEDILTAYPYLEAADIRQSLEYAAFLAEDENLELTR